MKKRSRKAVRRARILKINAVLLLAAFLFLWTYAAEEGAHYTPAYPMEDISLYLEQGTLTEEEYNLLYRQTGLSQIAIDALREQERSEEILEAQKCFLQRWK